MKNTIGKHEYQFYYTFVGSPVEFFYDLPVCGIHGNYPINPSLSWLHELTSGRKQQRVLVLFFGYLL